MKSGSGETVTALTWLHWSATFPELRRIPPPRLCESHRCRSAVLFLFRLTTFSLNLPPYSFSYTIIFWLFNVPICHVCLINDSEDTASGCGLSSTEYGDYYSFWSRLASWQTCRVCATTLSSHTCVCSTPSRGRLLTHCCWHTGKQLPVGCSFASGHYTNSQMARESRARFTPGHGTQGSREALGIRNWSQTGALSHVSIDRFVRPHVLLLWSSHA